MEAEAEVEMGRTARRRNMRMVVESDSEDLSDATSALNHRPASDQPATRNVEKDASNHLSPATHRDKKLEYNPDFTSLGKNLSDLLETARVVMRSDAKRILDEELAAHSSTREGDGGIEDDDSGQGFPGAFKESWWQLVESALENWR